MLLNFRRIRSSYAHSKNKHQEEQKMTTVLFIKANDRPAHQAVSVKLYEYFF